MRWFFIHLMLEYREVAQFLRNQEFLFLPAAIFSNTIYGARTGDFAILVQNTRAPASAHLDRSSGRPSLILTTG